MKETTQKQTPTIRLEPNVPKIVAAICYVIAQAEKSDQKLTQYDIVKTLFLADKKHINDYGRPVTFDNYAAMLHGPVPSFAYNLLKGDAAALRKYGKKLPWIGKKGEGSKVYFTLGKNVPSFDVLSESDKEALSAALTIIKSLTFSQIRQLTHNDPAYVKAWSDEENKKSYPMDLALFFDQPNSDAAQTLAFLSRNM